MKAIIYLRVSTDEQAASGLGLEAQEAEARRLCALRGYEVVAVHRDEGVSGSAPVDKRPGLLAALASLGRGTVLVAAKRDRLARDVGVAAIVETMAAKARASVETPDAPSGDDPFAQAMRAMIDVFAQLERAMIRARTKAALGVKRARGEKLGGDSPIGFDLAPDGKMLVADPDEARAVQLVRALRAEGLSIRAITARMNRDGVPSRGERWHPTTVARLLGRAA